ncbi:MAG: PDZ domain-containing protein, partial [Acidobacteriota bacterium]
MVVSRYASEPAAAAPTPALLHPRRTWRRVAPLLLGGVAGLALLLGVLNFYARGSTEWPATGVVWADAPEGVFALQIDPRGAAALAGLKVGDHLLELDGAPVTSALEAEAAPWETPAGKVLSLKVRRGRRILKIDLDPLAQEGEGQLYAYVATVGLFFLASGIYLLYRLGVGRIPLHYYLLCLAAFAVFSFSHTGEGTWLDWTFYSLDTLGRLLFPALMLHFVLIFPGRPRSSLFWPLLIYSPALLFGLVTIWMVPLGGALRTASPVLSMEHLDSWELLYTAVFFIACMAVLAIRSTRATILSDRRQLRWMAWGLGLGMMPFVVFYLVPRGLEVQTPPPASLSVLPLIILPLAFSAATLKYRLADLGLLVREGVTALTLIFFSLALFVLLNLTLRRTFSLPGVNDQIFTVLAAVLVFLLYPPLRQAVSALVHRAFYQGRYDYRRTLLQFGRELNSERELAPLLTRFHDRIRRTLPVRKSVLLCSDENRGGLTLLSPSAPGKVDSTEHHLPADHPVIRRVETEECVNLGRDERRQLPPGIRSLCLHALFPMRVEGELVAVLGVELLDPDGEMNREDRQ